MRGWRGAVMMVLGCVLVTGTITVASEDFGPTTPYKRRVEAIALVIAQDPRFAYVSEYDQQAMLARSDFDYDRLLRSGYYRVLPTIASMLARPARGGPSATPLARRARPPPTHPGPPRRS